MKVKNISNKIIGFGEVALLPEREMELPDKYADNPTIALYKKQGFISVSEGRKTKAPAKEEPAEDAKEDAGDAEALRKARLASLKGITPDALAALAKELGINMATCKDDKAVLAKVKAALSK